jgi:hypothetical protein
MYVNVCILAYITVDFYFLPFLEYYSICKNLPALSTWMSSLSPGCPTKPSADGQDFLLGT